MDQEKQAITLSTARLKKMAVSAARVAEKRGTLEALSHVLITTKALGADFRVTDLETTRAESIPYEEGSAAPAWSVAVDLWRLKKSLPGVKASPFVTLEPVDGCLRLTIASGAAAMLPTMDVENFPAEPAPKRENVGPMTSIGGEAVADLLGKTLCAVSTEESRFQLSGALLELTSERARMVATDGHRLHRAESAAFSIGDDEPGFMVPRGFLYSASLDHQFRAIGRGRKAAWPDVYIAHSDVFVFVLAGDVRYATRILEGNFPDYERVAKKGTAPCRITSQASHIADTLAAVIPCCGSDRPVVSMDLSAAFPVFSSSSHENGSASAKLNGSTRVSGQVEIPDSLASVGPVIGLNPFYLQQLCKPFGDEEIELCLWDGTTQLQVRAESDQAFSAVIMPVRV